MFAEYRWIGLGVALCACAQAETVSVSITDTGGAALARAVVVAVAAGQTASDHKHEAKVDQIDKSFVPGELVVQVGTLVHFPNSDKVRHQVYSFSPAKSFELPLYAGAEAEPVLFDKPGPVTLGCNIHDWMRGYIYVADSPWFTRTDEQGHATLDLPPGDYTVHVWHPQMRETEDSTRQTLSLAAQGTAEISWKLGLKPVFSPRRAPMGDAGGGY